MLRASMPPWVEMGTGNQVDAGFQRTTLLWELTSPVCLQTSACGNQVTTGTPMRKGQCMLKTIALLTGIIGLLLICISLAYGFFATKWKSRAVAWLIGDGVLLIIVSWVLFVVFYAYTLPSL